MLAAAFPGAAGAGSGSSGRGIYGYGVVAGEAEAGLRAGQVPRGFTGGPVTAATGEVVNIFVADELLATDPTVGQRWADFMTTLLHGPELNELQMYIAPLTRVRQLCGARALGCYDADGDAMVALGEEVPGITAQSVVMHEYGHHIAANRRNDPWDAIDYGTKRWASYENVCRRAESGELAPGDEGASYELNPGEVLAETYRVLSERRAGLPESEWGIVDPSLYPDDTALALLEQDITQPWTGNTVTPVAGSLGSRATGRGYRTQTAYDGVFQATLTSPPRSAFTLRVVDPATGIVLLSQAGSGRVKTARVPICGERTLQVQVKRVSGSGPFRLQISKP